MASDSWLLPSRYQLIKSLGSGACGSVFECKDTTRDELVAVKRLNHLFHRHAIDCKRILRELAILTRMDCDSVVRVRDIVIPGDRTSFSELYIVEEIGDTDLKQLLRADMVLKEEKISTLLYNLLIGLKYIHSAGVYHRDLKPDNILVNRNCGVKICDFNLARAVGEDPTVEHSRETVATRFKLNMTMHVVMRWYRAPELILMERGYTEAIDMWSVGCIYAELLQLADGSLRRSQRGPLFPGVSSCPLSPVRKRAKTEEHKETKTNDQLELIFNVIGTPSEEDIAALRNQDARKYVQSFPQMAGESLASRFPKAGPQEIDILRKMLIFSAKDRIGVEKALQHPLLASIRDPSREKVAPNKIALEFERDCDPSTGVLTEAQLRRNFLLEMERLHQGSHGGA